MKLCCISVVLFAALTLSPPATARPLSMAEAERLALASSIELARSRLSLIELEAQRKSLRGRFLPALKAEANLLVWDSALPLEFDISAAIPGFPKPPPGTPLPDFGNIRDQITSSITISLIQPITPLLGVYRGYQALQLGAKAALSGHAASALEVAARARKAYVQLRQAGGGVTIAESAVTQVEAQLGQVRAFHEGGLVGKNDVLKVEVGLARAKGGLVRARAGRELALAALALALGLPLGETVTATERFPNPPPVFSRGFAQCLKTALSQRPERAAVAASVAASRAQTRAARSALIPNVAALATYQHLEGAGFGQLKNTFFAGGVLSWEFSWGADYYKFKAARARQQRAHLTKKQLEDGIFLQLKKAYLELKTARQELAIAGAAIKQAAEAYRIEATKFKGSSATTTDVLDAQLALNRARLAENNALYGWYIARSELQRAMGDPLGRKN